ncbi:MULTISPECIES: cyclophilin-like fold protein [Vibrio]|uniref:Cyclophilin-like fold protein n=1 Tax=Vibrio aestuarianus TaxID=28171 RepID=A0ABD7YRM7_9VIBR|nr:MULTISPECIES: cyclophilin-like fold protein [Vibrio]WGK87621.1 cyclophilin-like fold protein [Vibrio aestuarianus]CAH8209488.1 conserved exported hypothetical protein [Vibrio aestuarianus]
MNNFSINTKEISTFGIIVPRLHLTLIKLASLLLLLCLALSSSYAAQLVTDPISAKHIVTQSEHSYMWITIGNHRFKASLIKAPAASEFSAMLPLTLNMDDLNNNEKHAQLPKSISTDEHRPKRIHNGDLMLWGNRTIVIFYKDFDTSYAYTRIGHIEDPSQLQQVLGQNEVSVIFSKN